MYNDVDMMWQDLLSDLLRSKNSGESRDGDVCGEIIGWRGTLDASKQRTLVANPVRKLSASYAAAETLWYMSGSSLVAMLKAYAPSYERFGDASGKAYGAYGSRIMSAWSTTSLEEGPDERSQLQKVIDMLTKSPRSRQAVLPFWDPHDLGVAESGECTDIPCTLTWQFLIRDGKLHMSIAMRSNDAWLGFPYDVFAFTCFQRIVAAHLNVEVGPYRHFVIGSMHLYERHRERAQEAAKQHMWATDRGEHGWRLDDTIDSCRVAVELERELRVTGDMNVSRVAACGNMSRDLLNACARKLRPETFQHSDFISERMRELCLSSQEPT